MPVLDSRKTIEQLKKVTTENINTVTTLFKPLSDEELNTKQSEDKWSIAECIKHINIANDYYIDNMHERIEKAIANGLKPTENYKTGWLGQKSAVSMKVKPNGEPNSPMKTMKMFYPEKSKIDAHEAINYFIERQTKLMEVINLAEQTHLGKIRIPLSMTKLITLKLGDALRFVVNHTGRHVEQARKVAKTIIT